MFNQKINQLPTIDQADAREAVFKCDLCSCRLEIGCCNESSLVYAKPLSKSADTDGVKI